MKIWSLFAFVNRITIIIQRVTQIFYKFYMVIDYSQGNKDRKTTLKIKSEGTITAVSRMKTRWLQSIKYKSISMNIPPITNM